MSALSDDLAALALLAPGPARLEADDLARCLAALGPRWAVADGHLRLALAAPGMAWAGPIAARACALGDELDHHPEVRLAYGALELRLRTHDAGGALTRLDAAYAARLEAWLRARAP